MRESFRGWFIMKINQNTKSSLKNEYRKYTQCGDVTVLAAGRSALADYPWGARCNPSVQPVQVYIIVLRAARSAVTYVQTLSGPLLQSAASTYSTEIFPEDKVNKQSIYRDLISEPNSPERRVRALYIGIHANNIRPRSSVYKSRA